MADDLAERATSWLQALWARRATDALAQAGALPGPTGGTRDAATYRRAPAASLRARLETLAASDALSEACDALDEVLAIARVHDQPRGGVGAVLDAARHPVLVTDARRRLVDASGAAAALLGVAREDLRRRQLDEFVAARWRPAFASRWASLEEGSTTAGALLLGLAGERELTAGYTAAIGLTPDRHLILVERVDGVRFRHWVQSGSSRGGEPVLRPREREVLALVAAGCTSAGIALHLELSRNTVESHIRNAVVRLGAANRTHAVVRALVLGEIPFPVIADGS